jgi:hypothetical protein
MRYRARGGFFSGGANLSWPLATLEIHPNSIRIAPRWFANRVLPPVEFARAEVTMVETNFGMTGGLRFRVVGPDDGTVFWAMGRTRQAAIHALGEAGLKVGPSSEAS